MLVIIVKFCWCSSIAHYTKPDGISDEEWTEHLKTMAAIFDWQQVHGDDPFIDPEELIDPELHRRREIFRQRYNFNKSKKQ